MKTFELHPDLVRDGINMGRFDLCHVLLINDSTYPWFVLVPARAEISNPSDLTEPDHAVLWEESRRFGKGILSAFKGEKINIAALGNMTPQLHVHHIVRFKTDPAWPKPIWGKQPMRAYKQASIQLIREALKAELMSGFIPL